MANTKRRSPASATVSRSAVEQASLTLQQLPERPKEVWSLKEAVDLLRHRINAVLSKGYGYDDVVAMLADSGVEITVSSLKSYLSQGKNAKAEPAQSKTKRPRKAKAADPTPAQVSEKSDAKSDGAADERPEFAARRKVGAVISSLLEEAEPPAKATKTPARRSPKSSADAKGTQPKAVASAQPKTGTKTEISASQPAAARNRRKKEVS